MRALNFIIFSISYYYFASTGSLAAHVGICSRACPAGALGKSNEDSQNNFSHDHTLAQLEGISLQKIDTLRQDKEFQDIVSELQTKKQNAPNTSFTLNTALQEALPESPKANLYIFVSFSLGEKALLNLAYEAKQFEATFVLRGFKDGSYRKTAQALQNIITKTGQGVLIDPELFSLFNITAVPSFILAKPFQLFSPERAQTPIHDRLQGHVSVHYALEVFAKSGDLKGEAQKLLHQGANP